MYSALQVVLCESKLLEPPTESSLEAFLRAHGCFCLLITSVGLCCQLDGNTNQDLRKISNTKGLEELKAARVCSIYYSPGTERQGEASSSESSTITGNDTHLETYFIRAQQAKSFLWVEDGTFCSWATYPSAVEHRGAVSFQLCGKNIEIFSNLVDACASFPFRFFCSHWAHPNPWLWNS